MNPEDNKEKPKYIYITLVFEDDKLNQHSMIDIKGAERVIVDTWPEFKRKVVSTVDGNDNVDRNIVTRNIYCIIIDYGENGIDVRELNASNS